jgi:hypothetical protein
MRKTVEASLIVVLTIVITALIMIVVFPIHTFAGASSATAKQDVRPAVYVVASGKCPVDRPNAEKCPALVRPQSDTACPYLSALTAGSNCPALMAPPTAAACPALAGRKSPKPGVQIARAVTGDRSENL